MIGIIGAIPFISFVFATLPAPMAAARLGARNAAVLSGGSGVAGLALMSQAETALALGVGVAACGVCTGLMMPALASAMQAAVKRSMHGRVTAVMNAGTSMGVVVAVPAALFLAGQWHLPGNAIRSLNASIARISTLRASSAHCSRWIAAAAGAASR